MALAGPEHHPQDTLLEDLAGLPLRKLQDLRVQLVESWGSARGIDHAVMVPRQLPRCTRGDAPQRVSQAIQDGGYSELASVDPQTRPKLRAPEYALQICERHRVREPAE